ncbi:MAG: biotin/lipoyl-containing protein, partial [Pseudomonas sp.]|nr:biotin/lipoyl-containing protein [Pseudomonas sp.]
VDSGIVEGDSVSPFYDPMLAKLIAWGETREEARLRLLAMLEETAVGGFKTNLGFLKRVLAHPGFAAGELDTGFIPRHQALLLPPVSELPAEFWQLAGEAMVQSEAARTRSDDPHSPWSNNCGWRSVTAQQVSLHLSCQGQRHWLRLQREGGESSYQLKGERIYHQHSDKLTSHPALRRGNALFIEWAGELREVRRVDPIAEVEASHSHQGGLTAPMNGSIVRVLVEVGQPVEAGAALVVLEAMKMEHSIRAPHAGIVKALYCGEGELVSEGTALVELEEQPA